MVETITRTTITHPRNQRQVKRLVEPASYDASKLWNCGLYKPRLKGLFVEDRTKKLFKSASYVGN